MFLLNGGLFGAWASRIPSVQKDLALGAGELGLLLLGLAGGAIVAFPLAGFLSDRYGSATVTKCVALFYGPSLIAIGLSNGIASIAIALVLFGAAHGAMDVAMNSWGAEVERHLERPIMSSLHAMFSLGAGIGAASGIIAVALGLDRTSHFVAFTLLLAMPMLRTGNVSWQLKTGRDQPGRLTFAIPKGGLLVVGVAAFCASLGEGAMADWSAVYLVSVVEAAESEAAAGYAVFSITMVVMRLLGDRLILRLGESVAGRLGGVFAALGVGLAIVGGTFWTACLGFALMGVGYAVIMPLAFSRAANDRHQSPGIAVAGVATFGYGGFLLGPVVIGTLAELVTLKIAFGLLALLAMVVAGTANALAKPALQRRSSSAKAVVAD
ncbi:MAG: MFS transporter [Geminicoccaceae bacterium]